MLDIRKNGDIYYKDKKLNPYYNSHVKKWKVSYVVDGKQKNESVDVLVAKKYLEYRNNKDVVIHKNGDIKDCRLENLVVVPKSEQITYLYQLIRGEKQ